MTKVLDVINGSSNKTATPRMVAESIASTNMHQHNLKRTCQNNNNKATPPMTTSQICKINHTYHNDNINDKPILQYDTSTTATTNIMKDILAK